MWIIKVIEILWFCLWAGGDVSPHWSLPSTIIELFVSFPGEVLHATSSSQSPLLQAQGGGTSQPERLMTSNQLKLIYNW